MYIYLYLNFNFPLISRCDPKALQCPGESNVFTTRSNFNSILCSHWWMFQSLAWEVEKFILCPAHIVSLVVLLPFVTWSFSAFYGLGRFAALLHVVLSVWSCNSVDLNYRYAIFFSLLFQVTSFWLGWYLTQHKILSKLLISQMLLCIQRHK